MKEAARTPGPLELSEAEMRDLGYRVIDLLVEHFVHLVEGPVGSRSEPDVLARRFESPMPMAPADPFALLDELTAGVFPSVLHTDHPRFFAFVPSPSNFVSVMGDALASGYNVFAGTWLAGSGAAQIELVVIDWLRQLCGLPAGAGGLLLSGGSMANLTGLAVARRQVLADKVEGAVVYCSDQTHSSVMRALTTLGFHRRQLRMLRSDGHYRLDPDALELAVDEDRSRGNRPFCVVANAGTTNTGAVDPLDRIAALCRVDGMWLHIDGAYGAPAVLTSEGASQLRGLRFADSLSLDPHKWLFQPFETGCLLVRDRAQLRDTFQIMPEYLRDTEENRQEVNFGNQGIQLTRSFRALKLWMSFKTFGVSAFRDAIQRGLDLARYFEMLVSASDGWEVVTPAELAIVTFRFAPERTAEEDLDSLNQRIVEEILAQDFAILTSTVLRGRTVLRICSINPRTTEADLEGTMEVLRSVASRLDRPA